MDHSRMPTFQKNVAQFVTEQRLTTSVEARLLDMLSEVGELSKEVLKSTRYGQVPFNGTEDWEKELGDVMFSLVCLANDTGVNLETALSGALDKYAKRIAQKGDAGSA